MIEHKSFIIRFCVVFPTLIPVFFSQGNSDQKAIEKNTEPMSRIPVLLVLLAALGNECFFHGVPPLPKPNGRRDYIMEKPRVWRRTHPHDVASPKRLLQDRRVSL